MPSKDALNSDTVYPNPWLAVEQSTLLHPDEHLPKVQRALAHYAKLYGTAKAGKWNETELDGAELLDGSLFVRVAWLTMGKMGWLREGESKGGWDFSGFAE